MLACNGWSVTTVEGLGSTRSGLGRVQARLSGLHGTQCGFCTPGMVMAMETYLKEAEARGEAPTIEQVRDSSKNCKRKSYIFSYRLRKL